MTSQPTPTHSPTTHYENFPVASWLCPARIRPAVVALYGFARTADDLADEGDATTAQRLEDLAQFRADLLALTALHARSARWPTVFEPLQSAIHRFALPVRWLEDLLDAFVQDVAYTDAARHYADMAELLDYCRRSANPIGRLLLHLYGVNDNASLQHSDAICTALQLINFWQDLSRDLPRGRYYLPLQERAALGVAAEDLYAAPSTPALRQLTAQLCQQARSLMLSGAPLVHTLGGRSGWELRLVMQGGLRILDKIQAQGFDTLHRRPALTAWDTAPMLWRALAMRRPRQTLGVQT